MPIVVPCPKCGTQLSAPDSAVGRRIRCPKFGCAATTIVPAFIAAEVIEVVEASVVTPSTKPKPVDEPDDDGVRKKSVRKARDRDEDEEEDDRLRRKRRDNDDDPRPLRPADNGRRPWQERESVRKVPGTTAMVGLVLGGLLIFGAIAVGIYALTKASSDARNDQGGESSGSNTFGFGSKSKKPNGSRITESGQGANAPEVVDAAWSKLLGKWEILPNPDLKATCEFNKDYSITQSIAAKDGQEVQTHKVVASILDRSTFNRALNSPWFTIGPNDRHYQITYETPAYMHESTECSVFENGTITAPSGDTRYYRLGETGPDGSKNPTLEETLWMLLARRRWGINVFNWEENIEFRKDKTVYWKKIIERTKTTIIEGSVSGIRVVPTGFVVLLGKHTINGRSQSSGELPEMYYLGKSLLLKRKEEGYGILEPK